MINISFSFVFCVFLFWFRHLCFRLFIIFRGQTPDHHKQKLLYPLFHKLRCCFQNGHFCTAYSKVVRRFEPVFSVKTVIQDCFVPNEFLRSAGVVFAGHSKQWTFYGLGHRTLSAAEPRVWTYNCLSSGHPKDPRARVPGVTIRAGLILLSKQIPFADQGNEVFAPKAIRVLA